MSVSRAGDHDVQDERRGDLVGMRCSERVSCTQQVSRRSFTPSLTLALLIPEGDSRCATGLSAGRLNGGFPFPFHPPHAPRSLIDTKALSEGQIVK